MDVKIFTGNIEGKALDQIYTLAKLEPFKDAKIRIMPDVHPGAGCVIGFTADLGDKVIANIVGADLGCGLLTVELEDKLSDIDLPEIDKIIRTYVPSGREIHSNAVAHFNYDLYCLPALKHAAKFDRMIGTLGGGNHFIEIDKDSDDRLYLIIHTGSRNVGLQVAEYYQHFAEERRDESQAGIPLELSYLEGNYRDAYLYDMRLCQNFAKLNRSTIADIIIKQAGLTEVSRFETVHNYIGDDNIIRKGAISAYKDQTVLIPLNMRDGCIIAIGKGNDDWNQSAPHGAGRALSRSKARENITLAAYEKSMEGIFTTSVSMSTIDESPLAYKSAEEIMCLIDDTVVIDKVIKPVYNFKASEV